MSLWPTGDRGQRYEISAYNYPRENEWTIMGWVELNPIEMIKACLAAPGCHKAKAVDRWHKEPLLERVNVAYANLFDNDNGE